MYIHNDMCTCIYAYKQNSLSFADHSWTTPSLAYARTNGRTCTQVNDHDYVISNTTYCKVI